MSGRTTTAAATAAGLSGRLLFVLVFIPLRPRQSPYPKAASTPLRSERKEGEQPLAQGGHDSIVAQQGPRRPQVRNRHVCVTLQVEHRYNPTYERRRSASAPSAAPLLDERHHQHRQPHDGFNGEAGKYREPLEHDQR